MILNPIPCLDKGFVALISSHNNGEKLSEIADELLLSSQTNEKLFNLSSMTVLVKCPLFVQLNLSQFGFEIINTKPQELEACLPHEGLIGASDLETSRLIADDMKRTTDALFINPKAYQADGCDRFISHMMTPINTYTTIIVHGSYSQWQKVINQKNLPVLLEAYRSTVEQIASAEWNYGKTKRFKEQDSK